MVEYKDSHQNNPPSSPLDRTYAALSDPTRRAILIHLSRQEARMTDLAQPFDMSLNAVSKHVRVLERAGLVQREVRGREHYLSLDASPLMAAAEWIETYRAFWNTGLNRLESFLHQKKAGAKGNSGRGK